MSKKKINFDGSCYDYLMRNGDFSCGFNMPNALKGENSYKLPPYAKRMPFLVDEYPACPENWMRSEGRLKSYFVPIKEDKGMWLDFNDCQRHTHHVAIVISIQGINPITGLPCNDPQMEQYIDECPKHKTKFGPDRYCKKCDYKWPKQNYITTTGTPNGQLWIDGFKAADGIVRQYILTAEKMRGVASNIIGKDRVYAIGLSFFLSKDKKPEPVRSNLLRQCSTPNHWNTYGTCSFLGEVKGNNSDFYESSGDFIDNFTNDDIIDFDSNNTISAQCCLDSDMKPIPIKKGVIKNKLGKKGVQVHTSSVNINSIREVKTKNLEIGAGAKINQSIYDDPERLEFWHDDPESIICINYCTENEAKEIVKQGKVDIEGSSEGFLKDIPVGN